MNLAELNEIYVKLVGEELDREFCSDKPNPSVSIAFIDGLTVMRDRTSHKIRDEIRAKKGMWMHKNDDHSDWLECSGCGHGEEGEVKIGEGTPFCPMCGREMLWEREEDR